MGVNRRQSTRTNASVSFVLRSLIILLTGISGWRMPIVSGSRAGLACANTSNSHRLRVSPRKAISSITTEKFAWNTIGCGQSRPGSKYSTSAGCCTKRRPQKANAMGLETTTSSSDFGAIRRYARESADRLAPCITFSWTRKMAQRRGPSGSWKRPKRLTTHFQHRKSTHSQHRLTPNTKNSLPTPKINSLPTQKALFGVEGESIFHFPIGTEASLLEPHHKQTLHGK